HRSQTALAEFEVHDLHVVAIPTTSVPAPGRRWIAACVPAASAVGRTVKPAVQTAAPLLAAITRIDDLGRAREHQRRAELLDALLDDDEGASHPELLARAAAFDLDPTATAHVLVLTPETPTAEGLEALVTCVRRQLERNDMTCLITVRSGRVVALVEAEADALRSWAPSLPAQAVGVGRPLRGLAGVARAFHDACQAAQL